MLLIVALVSTQQALPAGGGGRATIGGGGGWEGFDDPEMYAAVSGTFVGAQAMMSFSSASSTLLSATVRPRHSGTARSGMARGPR